MKSTAIIQDDPNSELIQRLSRQYTGKPFTSDPPGAQRLNVTIRPHKIFLKR